MVGDKTLCGRHGELCVLSLRPCGDLSRDLVGLVSSVLDVMLDCDQRARSHCELAGQREAREFLRLGREFEGGLVFRSLEADVELLWPELGRLEGGAE